LATKRKSTKRSKSRKSKSKPKSKSKSKGKKKPFGGYAISFSGREETMEDVFGKGKVTPSEMTKKIWKFIKAKRLASK
jgi:hypothetical protein